MATATEMTSASTSTSSRDLSKVPIHALRCSTKIKLSTMLNSVKVIPTEEGFLRDWRGLAELLGLTGETVSTIGYKSDPTLEILNLLCKDIQVTLHLLQSYLSKIDRWDVVDDTNVLFEQDAEEFLKRDESSEKSADRLNVALEKYILTRDDANRLVKGLEPQHYDAFLLYVQEDEDFASQIVTKMEDTYGLKLCLKDRDLVAGIFEHEAVMKMIAERCNRLIVVVSPHFLKSEAHKFFLLFAQALGIEQRQRKVIPCSYQYCQLPPELGYYFLLDYTRAGKLYDFWVKLKDSLLAVPSSQNAKLDVKDTNSRKQSNMSELKVPGKIGGSSSLRSSPVPTELDITKSKSVENLHVKNKSGQSDWTDDCLSREESEESFFTASLQGSPSVPSLSLTSNQSEGESISVAGSSISLLSSQSSSVAVPPHKNKVRIFGKLLPRRTKSSEHKPKKSWFNKKAVAL